MGVLLQISEAGIYIAAQGTTGTKFIIRVVGKAPFLQVTKAFNLSSFSTTGEITEDKNMLEDIVTCPSNYVFSLLEDKINLTRIESSTDETTIKSKLDAKQFSKVKEIFDSMPENDAIIKIVGLTGLPYQEVRLNIIPRLKQLKHEQIMSE